MKRRIESSDKLLQLSRSSRHLHGNGVRERFPILVNTIDGTSSSLSVILACGSQGSRLGAIILWQTAADSALGATVAAAGPDQSKYWKRSPPLAHSAKAIPPSSFPARAALAPAEQSSVRRIEPVIPGCRTFRHRPLIQNRKSFPDPVPRSRVLPMNVGCRSPNPTVVDNPPTKEHVSKKEGNRNCHSHRPTLNNPRIRPNHSN